MRGLQTTRRQLFLIALVHLVDEGAVPSGRRVEVMAERAIDEGVDHISVAEEKAEVEAVEKQGKDILGENTLEAFDRAVPVLIELFIAAEDLVEAVGRREFSPKLMNDIEGLRPALVAVAADHVGNQELAAGTKGLFDLVEKAFEVDDVMEGLVGDYGVIFGVSGPGVEVGGDEVEVRREAGGLAAAVQHGGVQVDAVEGEIAGQAFGEFDF